MIRLARKDEINALLALTQACAKTMISKGIFQWNEQYPSREAFQLDLERKELYVLERQDKLVGCIVCSTHEDEEYGHVEWLKPAFAKALYIHRLAVHPNDQGQGFAQNLMDFAENLAKEQNLISVRLDTFSQNARNQRFYEQRGYTRLGNIHFPKQSEHPFYCYEKIIV